MGDAHGDFRRESQTCFNQCIWPTLHLFSEEDAQAVLLNSSVGKVTVSDGKWWVQQNDRGADACFAEVFLKHVQWSPEDYFDDLSIVASLINHVQQKCVMISRHCCTRFHFGSAESAKFSTKEIIGAMLQAHLLPYLGLYSVDREVWLSSEEQTLKTEKTLVSGKTKSAGYSLPHYKEHIWALFCCEGSVDHLLSLLFLHPHINRSFCRLGSGEEFFGVRPCASWSPGNVVVDILKALRTLHCSCEVAHGDVSLSNILFYPSSQQGELDTKKRSISFILGDLESLVSLKSQNTLQSNAQDDYATWFRGSYFYSPPEMSDLNSTFFVSSSSTDVWSFGVVVMHMFQAFCAACACRHGCGRKGSCRENDQWGCRCAEDALHTHPLSSDSDEGKWTVEELCNEMELIFLLGKYSAECANFEESSENSKDATRTVIRKKISNIVEKTNLWDVLREEQEHELLMKDFLQSSISSQNSEILYSVDDDFVDFIAHSLHPDPAQRSTVEELYRMRWVQRLLNQ